MKEKKIQIPDGMLKAAEQAVMNDGYSARLELSTEAYKLVCREAVEAALRWLAENPPEFTEKQFREAREHFDGHSFPMLRYPFTVAFLEPEPEIPQEIHDLLWDLQDKGWRETEKKHNNEVIEAYRRGQKSNAR